MQITKQIFRRYISGKQGLWPGRRWSGLDGLRSALNSGVVVQIDPLCVLARSHDLALNARVADYQPDDLNTVLYTERRGFDWGGTVYVHPMMHIPYYRAIMTRLQANPYWEAYAAKYDDAIRQVADAIRQNGPQSNRSFKGDKQADRYWRTAKDTGRALYYLWMTGQMMTSHRKGFERYYDFCENIIPQEYQSTVRLDQAEEFLADQVFADRSAVTVVEFKNAWTEKIDRKMSLSEAVDRLAAGVKSGELTELAVEGNRNQYYIKSSDRSILEMLIDGELPAGWQPIHSKNGAETLFLAPLEIISARGRAKLVFDFEYLWEVYKPVEQRRWGYYNVPVMYGDSLVARFDARLERKIKQLQFLGYWVEDGFDVLPDYRSAFKAGVERLRQLTAATSVAAAPYHG